MARRAIWAALGENRALSFIAAFPNPEPCPRAHPRTFPNRQRKCDPNIFDVTKIPVTGFHRMPPGANIMLECSRFRRQAAPLTTTVKMDWVLKYDRSKSVFERSYPKQRYQVRPWARAVFFVPFFCNDPPAFAFTLWSCLRSSPAAFHLPLRPPPPPPTPPTPHYYVSYSRNGWISSDPLTM